MSLFTTLRAAFISSRVRVSKTRRVMKCNTGRGETRHGRWRERERERERDTGDIVRRICVCVYVFKGVLRVFQGCVFMFVSVSACSRVRARVFKGCAFVSVCSKV